MSELNQTEFLVTLESNNGAHPPKLIMQEGERVSVSRRIQALIFASLPDGRQVCIKKKYKEQLF
jgi:hypothetical protein